MLRIVCRQFLILVRSRECNTQVGVGVIGAVLTMLAGALLKHIVDPYSKAVVVHIIYRSDRTPQSTCPLAEAA